MDNAESTDYAEGTVKIFVTGFNPYDATFANAGSPYGPGSSKLETLPKPDIVEITITQISISQDNVDWRDLLNREYKVDLYSNDAQNFIKGVEVGGYKTVPAGIYPYCKIYLSEIIVSKQNTSYDSVYETAQHYGPPINPLVFTPDNAPSIRIISGTNNKVFFNSYFDYVITKTDVNGKYTLSGSPHYLLNPEHSGSTAKITGVLYWDNARGVQLTTPKYIALYKNKDDYLQNNPPLYGTFADYKGNFHFQTIAEGIYFVGAFIDINNNGIYESGTDLGMNSGPEQIEIKNGQTYPVTLKVEYNDFPTASTLSIKQVSTHSIELEWTKISDTDFDRFEIYQASYQYDNVEKQTLINTLLTSEAGTFIASGLLPETNYFFTIWTTDYSGAKSKSETVMGTTKSEIEVAGIYPLEFKPFGITFSKLDEPVITAKDTPHDKIVPDVIGKKYIYKMLYNDYSIIGETFEAPGTSPTGITYFISKYILTDSSAGKFYYLNDQLTTEAFVETPNGTPVGIDYNTTNGRIYSCDITENKVYEHNSDSSLTQMSSFDYSVYYPKYPSVTDIAFISDVMWSCDSSNRKIYKHKKNSFEIEEEFDFDGVPTGIVYFGYHLYVADHENNQIVKLKINK